MCIRDRDITARIAQEKEYSRLIDSANAPIFGVDADGKVNVWNRNAAALTGFTGDDVMREHPRRRFDDDASTRAEGQQQP